MGDVTHATQTDETNNPAYDVSRNAWNEAHAVPTNSIVKNNFGATTDPTVNDDTGDGYEVGSRWINTSTDTLFTCLDASSGAAVWFEHGAGGGVTLLGTTSVGGTNDAPSVDTKAIGKKITTPGAGIVLPPRIYLRMGTSSADVGMWGAVYTDDGGSPSHPLSPMGGWWTQSLRLQEDANTDFGWITVAAIPPVYVSAATSLWMIIGRSYQATYLLAKYDSGGSDVEWTSGSTPQLKRVGASGGPTVADTTRNHSIYCPFISA